MSEWVKVANDGDIDSDDAICVHHGDLAIAVYYAGGRYYATDDLCTHEHASLSHGFIVGKTVECPLHQSLFSLETGQVLAPPAVKAVRVMPVKVEDGGVYVEV